MSEVISAYFIAVLLVAVVFVIAFLVGYTLRAKPLARDYWTLSVWRDDDALRAFMRMPPHVGLMSSLKPLMGPTKFVTWTITLADGRPDWPAALMRLAA